MAGRNPKREYREVFSGPSKFELARAPAGWNPLDDYQAAQAADRAPSMGSLLQDDAVRALCPCARCTARRWAA